MLGKCILSIFFMLSTCLYSQVTIGSSAKPSESALLDLKEGMIVGLTDEELAYKYSVLANNLLQESNYQQSIYYYQKAKVLYQKEKNNIEIAKVDRKMGSIYERMEDKEKALASYLDAQKLLTDSISIAINHNDILRLQSSKIDEQEIHIDKNIEFFEKTEDKEAKVEALQQKAELNLKQNKEKEALENLNQAKENTIDPQTSQEIEKKIVNIYVDNKAWQEAEIRTLEIIKGAQVTNNVGLEIEQLQKLATIYFDNQQPTKGIESLKSAYQIAITNNRTIDTKNTLQLLMLKYKEQNNDKMALVFYEQFVNQLEPLVKSDSTLLQSRVFHFNEERVVQLEKERELKDELIDRTSKLNYILIASIVVALLLIIFIFKTLCSIKKKNKQIALQSLRKEMNPHFIFNSLNSINQFIMENNELEANKYLTSYSKLMRSVMENSNKDLISLATELVQLKEYLDLEYIRFSNKFEYEIYIDKSLDTESTLVPNMLIQPLLENAIWHGLRYKKEKGFLILKIMQVDKQLLVIIEDDGIGITKSESLKTKHQHKHQSLGLKNIKERIKLLNDLYNSDIKIEIEEKSTVQTGVVVALAFTPSKIMNHAR